DDAIKLLQYIGKNGISVVCPDIFVYEVLSVAAQNRFFLSDALHIIKTSEKSYLTITTPTAPQFELAMQITEDGNQKSGFPSIYDSTYHAMAISYDGVFITADKRHVEKARQYGHIAILHDWKTVLSA
ncbi:MAG: type II toxin-antitoxin system VapC family toxin, partial [Pseudomonadota bacterium]